MDLAFTQTQTDLKEAVRRYLGDTYPPARIAELADDTGHDAGAWPELQRQGWLDPELGMVELALLAEEGGRVLHPTPWWSTVGLALPVYEAAGLELPGPATLVDASDTCRATRDGDAWRLDGLARSVVDAATATEIVIAARTEDGVALFGVRQDGQGGGQGEPAQIGSAQVSRTDRGGIDPLRPVSDMELVGASARLLVAAPAATALLDRAGQRAEALLACEAIGVADRALEFAVDYAKTRHQFDRPIGSYQAVAHLLADSYAELELARSLVYRAALAVQDQVEVEQALACAVHAGRRAATTVCETAIQVCGGIGVTWEFPLHRWYRRALWLDAFHAGRSDPLATLAGILLGR